VREILDSTRTATLMVNGILSALSTTVPIGAVYASSVGNVLLAPGDLITLSMSSSDSRAAMNHGVCATLTCQPS
jgi:hypothetical protein